MKSKQILPQDHKFTEVLTSIAFMPKMLYYYGNFPDFDTERPKTVAIVGARKNTPYGEEVAYKLAYDLARQGVIIVSGLALGIDSIAHRGCLDAGGITLAILGTEITNIYPKSHLGLAQKIIASSGAVLSEYAPYTPPVGGGQGAKAAFLQRNRLISALSDATVVIEANLRSGSLNTATHAIEQGRELFAVPGDITRPLSLGTNGLLKSGAHPCTCAADVLAVIRPAQKKRQRRLPLGDTPEETSILKCINEGIRDGDQIMTALHLSPPEFNATITLLEIKSQVYPLGANHWAIK